MQAIEVKFLPVTNNKPDRLKAFCNAGHMERGISGLQDSLILRDISPSMENCAKLLAENLRNDLGWYQVHYGRLVMGTLKNGNYVFVFTGKEQQ